MSDSKLILIAGPYRTGTGDDPDKMRINLERLEATALEVWNRGHLPVIGEWLALPLMRTAGSRAIGDELYQALGYPVADRLIDRCDGVLRLAGESRGADGDVERARALGLPIYSSASQLPLGSPRVGRGA